MDAMDAIFHVPLFWPCASQFARWRGSRFQSSPAFAAATATVAFGARRAISQGAMLRITVDNNGSSCRLKLAGRLGGPWVPEMEKSWRSALCSPAKQIEIDMKEVTAVDDDGRELLVSMHRAGARFVAQGVAMTALVEEITGKQPPAA